MRYSSQEEKDSYSEVPFLKSESTLHPVYWRLYMYVLPYSYIALTINITYYNILWNE